jgi:hypothetical protein
MPDLLGLGFANGSHVETWPLVTLLRALRGTPERVLAFPRERELADESF